MTDAFTGEIRMFSGNYAPVGWLPCDGRALAISEFEPLFELLGTTYGGDGEEAFNVPDLRGRAPVHQGHGSASTYVMGEFGGVESVQLDANQMPAHSHPLAVASGPGTTTDPEGNLLAGGAPGSLFITGTAPSTPLASGAVTAAGGSDVHENRMPYLAITYIICVNGEFPSPV
ncbi:MAG TPA: tail fiber protein [Baekduia sp.]|jgi:microcystin-dependent protein